MEQTLIILKPDTFEKRKVGATIRRFENAGFDIVAIKMIQLDSELLREHYIHIVDQPFYPRIEQFMSSRAVIAMVARGESVIERARHLIGPTNSVQAPGGTIRGDWGTDMMRNIVHSSDGHQSAITEINRFFTPEELFA